MNITCERVGESCGENIFEFPASEDQNSNAARRALLAGEVNDQCLKQLA